MRFGIAMKTLPFLIIAVFGFVSLNLSCIRGEEKYAAVTVGSGLVLRAEPAKTSKRISVIPFDSRVKVMDTNGPLETIDGTQGRWYRIAYRGKEGWAFGGYLMIEGSLLDGKMKDGEYRIAARSDAGISNTDAGTTVEEEIVFSGGGKVQYRCTNAHLDGGTESEHAGKYTETRGVITIVLDKGRYTEYDFDPYELKKKIKSQADAAGSTITLLWSEQAKGFVTKDHEKYIGNPDYIIESDMCRLISKNDKKNMETPGKEFKTMGYFCGKR